MVAKCVPDFSVHMDDVFGTRTLVEIVDILRDQEDLRAADAFQICNGVVSGIGFDRCECGTAQVVEALDKIRIPNKGFRSGDLFDLVPLPQAVFVAEGRQTGFRGNTGAGENDDSIAGECHIAGAYHAGAGDVDLR